MKKSNKLAKGIRLGVAIGAAVSVALNNIAIGIGFVFAAASVKRSET